MGSSGIIIINRFSSRTCLNTLLKFDIVNLRTFLINYYDIKFTLSSEINIIISMIKSGKSLIIDIT